MHKIRMETPVGGLWIVADDQAILHVTFEDPVFAGHAPQEHTPVLDRCVAQLEEYFQGTRTQFDVPLAIHGTPFQKKVYKQLLTIPYGKRRSYKDIAVAIDNPKGVRAVGGANNKNPISILVPCHRVVGIDGSLVGYGGGLDIKKWLLDHEQAHLRDHLDE